MNKITVNVKNDCAEADVRQVLSCALTHYVASRTALLGNKGLLKTEDVEQINRRVDFANDLLTTVDTATIKAVPVKKETKKATKKE